MVKVKKKVHLEKKARMIRDVRDASKDYFIPLEEAEKLYNEGKLYKLEMGPTYPNSYSET